MRRPESALSDVIGRLGLHARFVVAIVAVHVVVTPTRPIRAAPPAGPPSFLEAFRGDLFRGVGSLHGGAFSGTWKERFETPEVDSSYQFTGRIQGMFDDELHCYALRRTTWAYSHRTLRSEPADYGVVRTPREVSRYVEISRLIKTHTLEDPRPQDELSPSGEYFDPRLAGFPWWGNLSRGDVFTLNKAQDALRRTPDRIQQEEGGRTRHEWESPHTFMTLWTETASGNGGLLPVKLSRRERYPDVDNNAWSIPLETHEVSWTRVEGAHVPKTVRLEDVREVIVDGRIPQSREERRYSRREVAVDLEWTRVNATFARDEFVSDWLLGKKKP